MNIVYFYAEKTSDKLILVDDFLRAVIDESVNPARALFNLYDSIAKDYPLIVLNGFSVYKDQIWGDRILFEKQ